MIASSRAPWPIATATAASTCPRPPYWPAAATRRGRSSPASAIWPPTASQTPSAAVGAMSRSVS